MTETYSALAGRYRLDCKIAAGGAGEVWRAEDLVLRRPVAVKRLHPEFASHHETMARFRSEARHAAALCHPGIAQVYDYDESAAGGQPFLVMELIDGPSLADVLTRGPLPARQVMDVVAQAAAGLEAAHQAGLVHRDIKPANLLLAPGGQVKITDFGIAYAAGSAPVTRQGMLIGTPAYLAPERVTGQQATPASDLYSLGILAHECLTGVRPYAGTPIETALAHGQQPLPPLPASVPPAVAAFVAELAAKDPAIRPPTAGVAAVRAAFLRDSLAPGAQSADVAGPPAGYRAPAAASQTMAYSLPFAGAHPDLAGAEQHPDSRAGSRRRGGSGRRVLPAAAVAVAAVALLAWLVSVLTGSPGTAGVAAPPGTPAASQPAAGQPAAAPGTVTLRAATLIGQPARLVFRKLRAQGLHPVLRLVGPGQPSAEPGTVAWVRPTGQVAPGSMVVVAVVAFGHHHGHGFGHGHHGHGHGDGNGQGGSGQGGD